MYYSPKARTSENSPFNLLSDHKITDEIILAKALAQVGGHIGNIDRLIAARERSRHNVFKDLSAATEECGEVGESRVYKRQGGDLEQREALFEAEYHQ